MKSSSRKLIKAISIIVLVFFSWTFGGVFDIAYRAGLEKLDRDISDKTALK